MLTWQLQRYLRLLSLLSLSSLSSLSQGLSLYVRSRILLSCLGVPPASCYSNGKGHRPASQSKARPKEENLQDYITEKGGIHVLAGSEG
jgi:hypothetical protein